MSLLFVDCVDSIRRGRTKVPETSTSGRQTVYIIFNSIPRILTCDSAEQHCHWTFLASMHVNLLHANRTFYKGVLYDFIQHVILLLRFKHSIDVVNTATILYSYWFYNGKSRVLYYLMYFRQCITPMSGLALIANFN